MDDSRKSIATNEESISMYLSFDADDTLASKWQSMSSQTSQYLDIQTTGVCSPEQDKTLEEKDNKKSVLNAFIGGCNETDHASPLRPFDKSILNKHNAQCSTPSKNATVSAVGMALDLTDYNKENTQPDAGGENSTLSISSASTVKANTLITDRTVEEASSVLEANKSEAVLENIIEVSHEESLDNVPQLPTAEAAAVNEVTAMIAKAMRIAGQSVKLPQPRIITASKRQSLAPAAASAMPRPRRSYLPTAGGETRAAFSFKSRMSVVVKTTLNSPARKLASSGASAASRRSCLPASKLTAPSSSSSSSRKSVYAVSSSLTKTVTSLPAPTKIAELKFNCKTCGASFRLKSLLDMHVRMHDLIENGPKTSLKKLNSSNNAGASHSQKHRCKYCDKNFALERALHIHLMQNCDKIPPSEKRKLHYTELNHVKKAQLPKVTGAAVSTADRPRSSVMSTSATRVSIAAPQMLPPLVKKVAKNVAHAGVYRTPTKTVPCHICKQNFKSILEYTNHCLTMHSKSQLVDKADAQSAARD